MKYYLYLTERRLFCFEIECGAGLLRERRERFHLLCVKAYENGDSLEKAFKETACLCGLEGQSAVLALEPLAEARSMRLPPSGKKTAVRMAKAQMLRVAAYERKCEKDFTDPFDRVMTVQLLAGSVREEGILAAFGKMPVKAMVYTADRNVLKDTLRMARQAGIRLKAAVPGPDFLAHVYEAERWRRVEDRIRLGKEAGFIVICPEKDGIRVCGIWKGKCAAWIRSELKPEVFLRLGGTELLYEELGDLACQAREEMETLDGRFAPAGIFLTAGCLEDAKGAAEAVEAAAKLPCICLEKPGISGIRHTRWLSFPISAGWGKRQTEEEASLALREMDVDSLGAYERNRGKWIKLRSGGNVGVFLLAVSLALFIGLGSFFQGKLENEQKRLTEVSEQLDRGDRQGEEEQLETLKDELEAVHPSSFLGILDSVLEPGLEIRQVEWDGEEGLLTIALRAVRAGQIPMYGNRVQEALPFLRITGSKWEKSGDETVFLGVITASAGKEEAVETE